MFTLHYASNMKKEVRLLNQVTIKHNMMFPLFYASDKNKKGKTSESD